MIARWWRRERRGTTSAEMGLVAVPLVMFIFGVVEVGAVIRMKAGLLFAVTNAARCASINAVTCGTTAKVQAYAATQTQGLTVAPSAFALTTENCGRKVVATVPFPVSAPSVLRTGLSFTVHACYPTQPSCNIGDLVTPEGLPGVCRA